MVVVDDEEDDGDEKVVEIPDRSVIPHLNSASRQQKKKKKMGTRLKNATILH